MKSIYLIFLLSLVAFAAVAQTQLPDTPAGKRVADYVQAFNSGDETLMLEFQKSNMTAAALQRRTDAERRQMYKQIYANLGALELRRVVEAKSDALTVLFFSKNKLWAQFSFAFEAAPPHKLTGIGIDEVDSNAPPEFDHATSKPTNDTELAITVGAYLDKQTQADEFSGVVLVAKNGKPLFHKVYGLAMALQNGKLLSPEYTQWILGDPMSDPPARAAVKTSSNLIKTMNGGLGIAGGAPGINAIVEQDIASGYTVIVLSNYDPPTAERVGRQIRSWLR